MYIISNTDMKQAIEYIEMMIQGLTDTDLKTYNKKRMASILLRKLRAKNRPQRTICLMTLKNACVKSDCIASV